jgi:hypothetical protein
VLHEPDAILLLGLIVAKEMGWQTPLALRLGRDQFERFRGKRLNVGLEGSIDIDTQNLTSSPTL